MSIEKELLKKIVEGALFAAHQPMNLEKLGQLFDEEERPGNTEFREVLAELETDYAERGLELKEVGSGWRFQVRQQVGPWVSRLWEEKPQRYSRALLETLALVAYRQPITRSEIEEIRGVAVSTQIIKTLQEREWIRVVGHRDVPGRPAMYATTREFLDYFNLKSLDELPSLSEIRDLDKINAELDLIAPPVPTSDLNTADSVPVNEELTLEPAAEVQTPPMEAAEEQSESSLLTDNNEKFVDFSEKLDTMDSSPASEGMLADNSNVADDVVEESSEEQA